MRDGASNAVDTRLAPSDVFWAVGSLCNLHRRRFDAELLVRTFPPPHNGATLVEALRACGLDAALLERTAPRVLEEPLPLVAFMRQDARPENSGANEASSRVPTPPSAIRNVPAAAASTVEPVLGDGPRTTLRPALVVRADAEHVVLFAAGSAQPAQVARERFNVAFAGWVVVVEPAKDADTDEELDTPAGTHPREPFGIRWFLPELARHRRLWAEVIAASLALQLLALALPLCSQVVIDKVIVHGSASTLAVVASALAAIVVFSAVLGWVRQYLVLHTGNRVDAVLASAVFRHLITLPIGWHERRATGALAARLAGIETIREFITGAAVTLALDVPFLVVFLALMLAYSVPLSVITLGIVAVLVALSVGAGPAFRARLDAQFMAGARTQAFVTEHLAAIETVKSLELEPELARRYDARLADTLTTSFATRQLANGYQALASALEQLMSASILCVGAWLALSHPDFTIGMLVAFQMFAARVAQPMLRLVGLWQQFQQAAVAVRRLRDVMDTAAEPRTVESTHAAPAAGRLELCGAGFRHGAASAWLYRGLDLTIAPGECILVTGPSGCGKSTLLRLLQGFAWPTEGAILVDGRDTRRMPVNELRSRLGVVPQETTLFRGTIRENLELAQPHATFADVVDACRRANVHDAIEALPDGYATRLGERGSGLSGGQKQRLSLARALLRRPRVLLLDEPMSQLDEASARAIGDAISRLRGTMTVVVVSHQCPPTLRFDRIVDLGAVPRRGREAIV